MTKPTPTQTKQIKIKWHEFGSRDFQAETPYGRVIIRKEWPDYGKAVWSARFDREKPNAILIGSRSLSAAKTAVAVRCEDIKNGDAPL